MDIKSVLKNIKKAGKDIATELEDSSYYKEDIEKMSSGMQAMGVSKKDAEEIASKAVRTSFSEDVIERQKEILNGLMERGRTYEEALMIMGNIGRETGNYDPSRLQQDGRGMTEEQWFSPGIARGTGLIQWDDRRYTTEVMKKNQPKRKGLKNFAEDRGKSWDDMQTQLDFLDYEIKGPEKKAWEKSLKGNNIVEKTREFAKHFERAGTVTTKYGYPEERVHEELIDRPAEALAVSIQHGPYIVPKKLPKNTPKIAIDENNQFLKAVRNRIKNEA